MSAHKSIWLGLGLLILALGVQATQAMVLTLRPAAQTGSVLAIDVEVSGLGDFDSTALTRYEIGVSFPSSLLQLQAPVDFGDLGLGDQAASDPLFVSAYSEEPSLDPSQHVLFLQQDAGFALSGIAYLYQPDSFRLATLTFTARTQGIGQIGVLPFPILLDQDGNPLPLELELPAATVTAVPEPTSLALVLFGLAALALWSGQRHGATFSARVGRL